MREQTEKRVSHTVSVTNADWALLRHVSPDGTASQGIDVLCALWRQTQRDQQIRVAPAETLRSVALGDSSSWAGDMQ